MRDEKSVLMDDVFSGWIGSCYSLFKFGGLFVERILLIVSLIAIFSTHQLYAQPIGNEAQLLLSKVDSVMKKTQSMHFQVEMFARMRGDDYKQLAEFKITRSPLKIYYKQFYGKKIELLYNETVDKKKALVYPDGFPYTSIRLSPVSSRILERQHHSVFEADPMFIVNQILRMCVDTPNRNCSSSLTDTVFKGKKYHRLFIQDDNYGLEKISVDKKYTVLEFANARNINYYSLIWYNGGLSVDTQLKEGSILNVPTSYAKSILMLVDPENFHIRFVRVYDMDGVFEWFEYKEFNRDVAFDIEDFDEDNSKYNF